MGADCAGGHISWRLGLLGSSSKMAIIAGGRFRNHYLAGFI